MGAIASVLQWHCGNCSLINPTEQARCLRCGTVRQIRAEHGGGKGDGKGDGVGVTVSDEAHSQSTIFGSNANCTVIRKPRFRRIIEAANGTADDDTHSRLESTHANCTPVAQRPFPCSDEQRCTSSSAPLRFRRSYSDVTGASEYRAAAVGRRCSSAANLSYHWRCQSCSLVNNTVSRLCFGCESSSADNPKVTQLVSTSNMNVARCKNCSSRYDYAITPVEHPQPMVNNANALLMHKYELLNYGSTRNRTHCNCPQKNMISLSSINKYNKCAPSTACDGFLGSSVSVSPKRHTSALECVRTKVSRSVSNDSMNYKSDTLEARAFDTWTCSNCTLVNSGNALICDACETPYRPDVNKNSSVLIKVDNWDDNNDSSKQPCLSLPKPSYRRSFSDLPHCSGLKVGANRRSLGDGILEAATAKPPALDCYSNAAKPATKHNVLNKMCNSVSSNILGSAVPNARASSCDDSKPLYTYIGISDPTKHHISNHVYENQLLLRPHHHDIIKPPNDFKLPSYDKNTQDSM